MTAEPPVPDLPPPGRHALSGQRLLRCDPHPPGTADLRDGRLHLGSLEGRVWRQWAPGAPAPSQVLVEALSALAGLPARARDRLADTVDKIYLGPGSVVDLDHMGHLKGSGEGRPPGTTWDSVAGVWWSEMGIVAIGDIPSRSAAVAPHEVGHVLVDADRLLETTELATLHRYCRDALADELFADSVDEFAAEGFARAFLPDPTSLLALVSFNESRALAVRAFWMRLYG